MKMRASVLFLLLQLYVVLGGTETESTCANPQDVAAELKFLKELLLLQAKKLDKIEDDVRKATRKPTAIDTEIQTDWGIVQPKRTDGQEKKTVPCCFILRLFHVGISVNQKFCEMFNFVPLKKNSILIFVVLLTHAKPFNTISLLLFHFLKRKSIKKL